MVDNVVSSLYADRNLRAGAASQPANRVMQVARVYRDAVHRNDLVAAANSRSRCRRARYWSDDHDVAAVVVDFDANARVATGGADTNIPIFGRIQVLRVSIQVADHTAYCALEKLSIIDRFHVVTLDALENLRKQPSLLPGQLRLVGGFVIANQAAANRQAQTQHQANDNNQNCTNFQ